MSHATFKLWQDGVVVAAVSGPREAALRDIQHYAFIYLLDGPVKIKEVRPRKRKKK